MKRKTYVHASRVHYYKGKPIIITGGCKSRRRKIIALLGGRCIKCGSTENLELHHAGLCEDKTRSKNRWGTWNNLDLLDVLCRNCHRPFTGNRPSINKTHEIIQTHTKQSIS